MIASETTAPLLPYTGKEFLDSLDDGREVWIYGERVKNIAEHPAFRNTARMIARLYDALHRTGRRRKGFSPARPNGAGSPIAISPRRAPLTTSSPGAMRSPPGRG